MSQHHPQCCPWSAAQFLLYSHHYYYYDDDDDQMGSVDVRCLAGVSEEVVARLHLLHLQEKKHYSAALFEQQFVNYLLDSDQSPFQFSIVDF
jgi:hypothetical protein